MHVFLFDIDGTLVNTRGAGRMALTAALASEFGMDDVSANLVTSGRTDRGIAADLFADHGIEHSPENWQRLAQAYLQHLPRSLVAKDGQVLPGVRELLAELHQQPEHIALGLLTGNTKAGAQAKLEHFGIWEHFDFGAFGDEHLNRNAVAADALEIARHRLQHEVPPERIVVIGDTPLDILCARHIGAHAVAVATGLHPKDELVGTDPDVMLDDLSNIQPVMDFLNGR